MLDNLAYGSNPLRCNHLNEEYMVEIEVDCSKKPTPIYWEEQTQLSQCNDDNQTLHAEQYCKE